MQTLKLIGLLYVLVSSPFYVHKAAGDKYRRLGYYYQALTEYNKAISLRRESPECYYWRAYIYKEMQLYDEALMELGLAQKYIAYTRIPNFSVDIRYLKAEILSTSGRIDEALDVLLDIVGEYFRLKQQEVPISYLKYARGLAIVGVYYLINKRPLPTPIKLTPRELILEAIHMGYKPSLCYYLLGKLIGKKEYVDKAKYLDKTVNVKVLAFSLRDLTEIMRLFN